MYTKIKKILNINISPLEMNSIDQVQRGYVKKVPIIILPSNISKKMFH